MLLAQQQVHHVDHTLPCQQHARVASAQLRHIFSPACRQHLLVAALMILTWCCLLMSRCMWFWACRHGQGDSSSCEVLTPQQCAHAIPAWWLSFVCTTPELLDAAATQLTAVLMLAKPRKPSASARGGGGGAAASISLQHAFSQDHGSFMPPHAASIGAMICSSKAARLLARAAAAAAVLCCTAPLNGTAPDYEAWLQHQPVTSAAHRLQLMHAQACSRFQQCTPAEVAAPGAAATAASMPCHACM